jgi:thymidylate synthase
MYHFEGNTSMEIGNKVYAALAEEGMASDSRNGRVLRFDEPVSITYLEPINRCNFTIGRDANPVFHHMEAVWMLAGRRDVAFPSIFNSNIENYSDDGKVFNAAYGHRMRRHFGIDQLKSVCMLLVKDPDTRQAVIQLWDPVDLTSHTKDKACNMSMVFEANDGHLNVTIFNRSNDAIWGGVTGANPVHFSYIMQYVYENVWETHEWLRFGTMTFVSNNLHVYLDLYPHWKRIKPSPTTYPYTDEPNIGKLEEMDIFCEEALYLDIINVDDDRYAFTSDMLIGTTIPMFNYWIARKFEKDKIGASYWLEQIQEPDWKLMINHWDRARLQNEHT